MASIRIDRCPKCGATLRERSVEQNSKLHAVLQDIANQKEWAGRKLDVTTWKRLLVSAWERACKRSAEFYPAVDGAGFDIVYTSTARLSKEDVSELTEFAIAWAIENEVTLHDAD